MNVPTKKIPANIEAAAIAWLELRDAGKFQGRQEEKFLAWLDADPRHLDAFEEIERVWSGLDQVANATAIPAAEPVALPRDRISPWLVTGALAAAAALALGVFLSRPPADVRSSAAPQSVVTISGETRVLHLSDGSLIRLDANSELTTDLSPTERCVRLLAGSARFAVAKDKTRPFTVTAGVVAVRAVGTAFNVRRGAAEVEVQVTEGKVRVDDARSGASLLPREAAVSTAFSGPVLAAGEKVVIATFHAVPAPAVAILPLAVPAATPASEVLVFDGTPLEEVVRTLNAHNAHQLVIVDDRLREQRFTGKLRSDGYASLAHLLQQSFGIATEEQGDRTLLGSSR